MIDKKFGKVLKALRTERGLSQEEFAMNVGLHRTYISQLERGLKSPSLRIGNIHAPDLVWIVNGQVPQQIGPNIRA